MTLLKVEGLTKRFGGVTAVNDLSLEVEAGSIHGLIGPNGSGKTTAINTISGYYVPTSGKVIFNGEPIAGMPSYRISAKGLGRTFQATKLFKSMTVGEHLRLGMTACAHRPKKWTEGQVLDMVGLKAYRDEKAISLPYGLQKRVDIMRAIAGSPDLLLLDEPVAGLNEEEIADTSEVFKKLQLQGIAILLVEHHMKLVMSVCDIISVLNFGKKIAEGRPSEIKSDPLVMEAYLGKGEP